MSVLLKILFNVQHFQPTADQLKRGTASSNQTKPSQLLWAKALEGVHAVIPLQVADKAVPQTETIISSLSLAARMHPVLPIVSEEVRLT